ncbi:MAG: Gfo/Idh/MocA family oxidoreductase, partial [Bacillota bacterium]|nr:Gfo/Idh/MocA family oxidoreductase [Bacillota bacterium]
MKSINIAVIGGAGWIGGVHSECYKRLALMMPDVNINLHTTIDVFEEPIKKAANKYGFKNWSLDFNDAVEDKEIDLIDICCSNDLHKEVSIKAAEAGKHVLCEKPLAMNTKDAEEMCSTVARCKVNNMINFVYRKYPSIAYVKEIISSGG